MIGGDPMNVDYLFACGAEWQQTGDPEAGGTLVEGLRSEDPGVKLVAETMLVESGARSMRLLEAALENGTIELDEAGDCILEILQRASFQEILPRAN